MPTFKINENNTILEICKKFPKKLIIVDFWAPWCGPCNGFKPIFKKLSEEHKDCIFLTADIDKNKDLSDIYNIQSIPHIIFFKNNKKVDSMSGGDKISLIHKISTLKNSDSEAPLAYNS